MGAAMVEAGIAVKALLQGATLERKQEIAAARRPIEPGSRANRHAGPCGALRAADPPSPDGTTGRHLEQLGIVRELTAQKRNRLFSYHG